jgi:hypothetical protein
MLLLSNGGKVMAKQRRVFRQSTTVDAMRKIRKPPIPKGQVINPKKGYNRKDKSWRDDTSW